MTSSGSLPSASVVMLAYGAEEHLERAVDAVLASTGLRVELTLVDNGCTSDAVTRMEARGVELDILRPGHNTGFAGGCNLGAAHSTGDVLVFVNSDAIVAPDAVMHLVRAVSEDGVGVTSASLRLSDAPDIINSVGNPIHYLGLSWAGGLGDPATQHQQRTQVAACTGAALAIRRPLFHELDGFCELMFAYHEDAELCLRAWAAGWRCEHVPEAVVVHHYEFSRNPWKLYLIERNRLIMLLTVFERRTLAAIAPALLGLELAMLALAAKQGWGRQKLAGWWWIVRHRRELLERRRVVQATRVRDDAFLTTILADDVTPGEGSGFGLPGPARTGSRLYWRVARRILAGD